MNQKLSRAWVVFAFTLLFTAMIGIVAVGLLTAADNQHSQVEATASLIVARNETIEAQIAATQAAAPTATPTTTPSILYEPTLYSLRRTEQMAIWLSPEATRAAVFDATETALVAIYQGTAAQVTPGPCFFNWARQPLPDVAEQARTAFDQAGLPDVEVRYVEAYGENCLEADGQTVRYFAAMTTDFYLSAAAGKLDEEDLGQIFENSYDALLSIPRDSLPARPGYLDFLFISGQQEKRLRLTFDQIEAALDAGQHGADLWAMMPQ